MLRYSIPKDKWKPWPTGDATRNVTKLNRVYPLRTWMSVPKIIWICPVDVNFSLHQFMQIHVSRERFLLQPQNEYKPYENQQRRRIFLLHWMEYWWFKGYSLFSRPHTQLSSQVIFANLLLFFFSHSNTSRDTTCIEVMWYCKQLYIALITVLIGIHTNKLQKKPPEKYIPANRRCEHICCIWFTCFILR